MTKLFASSDRRELNRVSIALVRRRHDLKLTQADLSGRTGISRRSISRVENGSKAVQFDHVLTLASAVGVHVEISLKPPRAGNYTRVRYYECSHCGSDLYSAQQDANWCPACGYGGTLTRGLWPEYLVMST